MSEMLKPLSDDAEFDAGKKISNIHAEHDTSPLMIDRVRYN
jgi:hypothetical protein